YSPDNGDGRARVVAEDQSTQLGAIRSSSVQISGKFRQRPEVDHVVLDHQARFGVRDDLLDAIDRGQRIGALEVDRENAAVLAVVTSVVEIAREDDHTRFPELDLQHLMTRRVPRRLEYAHAAVAEYVMVSVDHLRPDVRVGTEGGPVGSERW